MHIIPALQNVLDIIKMYHWMTQSHPRHVASDSLHEKMSANVDRFAEVFIGKYGRPTFKKTDLAFSMKVHTDSSIVPFLDDVIHMLTDDITKHIAEKDVDLLTIRDEIVADINQTKYLFTLK
jgi:hypothetical protein